MTFDEQTIRFQLDRTERDLRSAYAVRDRIRTRIARLEQERATWDAALRGQRVATIVEEG